MNIIDNQSISPLLSGELVENKRQEIKQYFINTWQTYDSLFNLIKNDDAFYSKPEPLRHPLIFYFGHTASFYINKLLLGKFIFSRVNEKIESVCAVGVDEMSWDDLNSENYQWPTVNEVREYRQQVFSLVCKLIDDMPLTLPIESDSLAWIMLMGSEHERIHLETSSVIIRMLPIEHVTPNDNWLACSDVGDAPKNQLINVHGKNVLLGKPESAQTYGWDNEYGEAEVVVPDFSTSQFLVSNQEFIEFINAGGYQNLAYWTEEGQQWLKYKKPSMPVFWLKKGEEYFQRNLTQEILLPLNWPAEVNYLEAKAFCNFKTEQTGLIIRLPSEAEWSCLRDFINDDINQWQQTPGNINLAYSASSSPVDRYEHNGIYDIVGNVWQWTESPIDGFNGFEVHPLYDDFSTPTFDGKHNLIKGGSWISTGNEATRYSRYAFRRHFFQHAGFRYVASKSEHIPNVTLNRYENDEIVCQELNAQYGKESDIASTLGIKNYSKALVSFIQATIKNNDINTDKLLDLGCSVGASSFLLSSDFSHIDAIDFSARFIQHGVQLQQGGCVRYETVNEGDIVNYHEVTLTDLGTLNSSADVQNILFSQGDAANLKPVFTGYDVVVAQQVLEKSYNAKAFLETIHQRITSNGYLIIASDYQFNEDVSSKDKWIGGIKVNGENRTGFDGLSDYLSEHFSLVERESLPRLISQSTRNFSLSQQEVSVWQLKA